MNIRMLRYFCCTVVLSWLVAGCSGKGPSVVDPEINRRAQQSLLAVDRGGAGELVRFSELDSSYAVDEYAAANGEALGKAVDAVYSYGDYLYLHHRDNGSITKLALATRKKAALIEGFPSKGDGQMCSMAFSNSSQGWVVCYGSKNLFHVDTYFGVVADTIALPGNPTCVATSGTYVFVCMENADGTGAIAVIRSNLGGVFTIEKTIALPSPGIFATHTADSRDLVVLTAGNASVKPGVTYIGLTSLDVRFSDDIEAAPLTGYLGKEPTYVAYTRIDNMYVALPDMVVQIPFGARPYEWLTGNYSVIGADPGTDLFYAYAPGSNTIKRLTADQVEIPDLPVPAAIRAIFFLGTNQVR